MNDSKEKNVSSAMDLDREWVAPQLTVLNTGATASGPTTNTFPEGTSTVYHPS